MLIRAATRDDIPAIARVHVDMWRTTYLGIVPDEHLAKLSYKQRERVWYQIFDDALEDGNFTLVAALPSGEIVGFANGGRERGGDEVYQGELNALYIRKECQGQGIGRMLVGAIAKQLSQTEMNTMLVWVLAENPARQFYASLGGHPIHEKHLEIGGKVLLEVAYGWTDLADLRKL